MKKINFPNFTIEDVYALSLSFIDQSKRDRKKIFDQLQDLSPDIYGYGAAYESYAENNNLHLLDSNNFFHVADDFSDIGWLKANFRMQENILEVEFDVNDDLDIPKSLLDRIQYTFNELEMASYLSDKASETETTNIMSKFRSDQYWMDYTNDEITEVLISDSELFYKSHGKNHWLTVLYKELSLRSDLYGVLKLF